MHNENEWPVKPELLEHGRYWQEGVTLVNGCTPLSPGCKNCWAAMMEHRFRSKNGLTTPAGHWAGKIKLCNHLLTRLDKTAPRVISIWNDLFHGDVPLKFHQSIINRILLNRQHIYLLLTKRPQNIPEHYRWLEKKENVFIGVTVEDNLRLQRIEVLRNHWAGRSFVSIEPLLVHLNQLTPAHLEQIDWAIIGAESGSAKRTCKNEWVAAIVRKCRVYNTPVFVKQVHINNKLSKEPATWPVELRVRELPKVRARPARTNSIHTSAKTSTSPNSKHIQTNLKLEQ